MTRRRRTGGGLLAATIIALGLIAAAVGVVIALGSGSPESAAPAHAATQKHRRHHRLPPLPEAPAPAFKVGKPIYLKNLRDIARYAPVTREVEVLAQPQAGARALVPLATTTDDGTTNIVLIIGRARHDAAGRIWVHVRMPILPNGVTGWVPRSALGPLFLVHTHLDINLERLRVTLLRDGKPIFSAPIGAGRPEYPTPRGQFYVRDKLTEYASPFYGPVAFGTSARSAVLTDWPDGGFIGIHGTNQPYLIPGRISHGCVRLRNADILRLAKLMPVGTPITIS
jgi:hypothetical protein